ncbi:MAG: ComEA family DNA-binding protein [Myxococcota bacterium]
MSASPQTASVLPLIVLLFFVSCAALGRFALGSKVGSAPTQCGSPLQSTTGAGCQREGAPLHDGRRWLFGAKVSLVSATERELVAIPGVGPSLARRILDERRRSGGFQQLGELRRVRGIGPVLQARLEAALEIRHGPHDVRVTEAPIAPHVLRAR